MKAFSLCLTALLLTMVSLKTVAQTQKKEVEIVFTREMGMSDLDKIREALKEQGISIQYNKAKFNKDGLLTELKFTVVFDDGMEGSAENHNFASGKRFGFRRDFSKNAKVPLIVGFL